MTDWIILGLRILALCLLLLFLGLSFYHLKKQSLKTIPKDYLQQLDPPQGKFPLHSTTSFGRHPDNTYTLTNVFISAHHATIIYQETGWWLTDHHSCNGTTLNAIPVKTPTQLNYEDIITLGDLKFQLLPEKPSAKNS